VSACLPVSLSLRAWIAILISGSDHFHFPEVRMRRLLWLLAAGLLLLPLACSDDKNKQQVNAPPQPATPKGKFDALDNEFKVQQMQLGSQFQTARPDEQQKIRQKAMGLGNEFADRFYQLAEDNPKDPVALDALFWVLQNAPASPVYPKAADKVAARVDEMPLKDLAERLSTMRGGNPKILDSVFQRAEKEESDPLAGDLLGWVAMNGGMVPVGQQATERLLEKYPDHAAVERLCLTMNLNFPKAADTLKLILDKSKSPRVRATAALGLGKKFAADADNPGANSADADKAVAQAEKYLAMVVDQFGNANPALKAEAERERKKLNLRVGKEAPDIVAKDLDGKEFKLSDYRGKVVLLDFWGNW